MCNNKKAYAKIIKTINRHYYYEKKKNIKKIIGYIHQHKQNIIFIKDFAK